MDNAQFKELARRCLVVGTEQAEVIDEFFKQVRPYLLIQLSRLNPLDDSTTEDALQLTFLKYVQFFRQGRVSEAMLTPAYMVTVAKHCLIDEVRRRQKYVSFDEMVDGAEAEDQVELREPGRSEVIDLILLILDRMDPRCRYIIERYYFAEIKGPVLASELGISPQSLPMTVKRCRDELRRRLELLMRSNRSVS
jgi:RNA polymerase sigma factor (sigma-70 family)